MNEKGEQQCDDNGSLARIIERKGSNLIASFVEIWYLASDTCGMGNCNLLH